MRVVDQTTNAIAIWDNSIRMGSLLFRHRDEAINIPKASNNALKHQEAPAPKIPKCLTSKIDNTIFSGAKYKWTFPERSARSMP